MEERDEILKKIDEYQKELLIITHKQEAVRESLDLLRNKIFKYERRRRQIHNEIMDIQDRVKAWESASNNANNSHNVSL